jgi:hypothetical protein
MATEVCLMAPARASVQEGLRRIEGSRPYARLTGESFVPVLILDDGAIVKDSKNIVAWALGNPIEGPR